ncbi:MAG: AtpZ/AtpI family protein [Rhodothermales bacterium]|nr:AtpZ/AtpI family protein [Rhodothermales bacterium]
MEGDDSSWDDWGKADKYDKYDREDWGYRAKSDQKWEAWNKEASWDDDRDADASRPLRDGQSARDGGGTPNESWQSAYREAGPFLDIGLNLAVTIVMGLVVFLGGGSWLDGRFDTEPIFTITGALLAFVVIGYRFYSGVRQLTRLEKSNRQRSIQKGPDSKSL